MLDLTYSYTLFFYPSGKSGILHIANLPHTNLGNLQLTFLGGFLLSVFTEKPYSYTLVFIIFLLLVEINAVDILSLKATVA